MTPAVVETTTVPIGVEPLSVKVTVPAGSTPTLCDGVTVAVKVTLWP